MGYTALVDPMQQINPNMVHQFGMPSGPSFGDMGPIGSIDPVQLQSSLSALIGQKAPTLGGGGFLKGFGMDEAKLAMGGLQTIGQLWGAIQSAKMAKKTMAFEKEKFNTNLTNQIKSYNTQLMDRGRSRAVVEGQTPQQAQAYIDQNKLTR